MLRRAVKHIRINACDRMAFLLPASPPQLVCEKLRMDGGQLVVDELICDTARQRRSVQSHGVLDNSI